MLSYALNNVSLKTGLDRPWVSGTKAGNLRDPSRVAPSAVLDVVSIPGLESHSQLSFISTPSSNMSSSVKGRVMAEVKRWEWGMSQESHSAAHM